MASYNPCSQLNIVGNDPCNYNNSTHDINFSNASSSIITNNDLPRLDVIFPVHPFVNHELLVEGNQSKYSTLEIRCWWPCNLSGNMLANINILHKSKIGRAH